MGQKDLTAKELESRPDVFADIINALIYEGEQIVSSGMLQAAPTETLYASIDDSKTKDVELANLESEKGPEKENFGTLRNQYHDVSKYEMEQKKIKIQYVLENESGENYRLLLRKAGYEGAIYRNEYEDEQIYPVVILVLYWGDKEWKPHTDMYGLFTDGLNNPKVRKYVDNIKLHLYPMAHLPEEIRQRFQSDMRIVVDYLAEGESYKPTGQVIRHIGPMLRLLYALTGEEELLDMLTEAQQKQDEGGETIMGEYYTTYFAKKCRQEGMQEGVKQGIKQGVDKLNNLIRVLIEKGREEDMRRSLEDKEYQEELFREFGL